MKKYSKKQLIAGFAEWSKQWKKNPEDFATIEKETDTQKYAVDCVNYLVEIIEKIEDSEREKLDVKDEIVKLNLEDGETFQISNDSNSDWYISKLLNGSYAIFDGDGEAILQRKTHSSFKFQLNRFCSEKNINSYSGCR